MDTPEAGTDSGSALVAFDDVLSRELDAPTVIDLAHESSLPAVPAPSPSPVTEAPAAEAPLVDATLEENAALRAELLGAPVEPDAAILPTITETINTSIVVKRPDPSVVVPPVNSQPIELGRGIVGFDQFDFWDRYDEASASADLFAVPPAAITVVVGPLDSSIAVAERCKDNHWVSDCDVFVLTERQEIVGQPTWTTVRRPSDVVAVIEGGLSDFPLLVLDIPRELPAWVRPLIARLREHGVGLVHYVLPDDPNDEDLATWHGELGRPSVLDLATPVAPERVLELLDRGEPIASVAGMPITTELLLALRLDRC